MIKVMSKWLVKAYSMCKGVGLRDLLGYLLMLLLVSSSLFTLVMGGYSCDEHGFIEGVIVWYSDADADTIAGSYVRYVLVDPDYGPRDLPWSPNDLMRIKAIGTSVIAYLNIGFAEEWRDYWSYIVSEKPKWVTWVQYPGWEGEYFVKYRHVGAWGPGGWVDVLKHELRKIIELGFDGVIFDNIDSCDIWENPEEYGLDILKVANATDAMVRLVKELSAYAKSLKPDVIIVVNMGGRLDLLKDVDFLNSIDIVLRECVWYCGDEAVDTEERDYAIYWLSYARDYGKEVIVLDYATKMEHVLKVLEEGRKLGFEVYVSPTWDLNKIPNYIPSFNGLDSTIVNDEVIAVWGYRGPLSDGWRSDFDVYVGVVGSDGVELVKRLGNDGINDRNPRVVFDGVSSKLVLVWESGNDLSLAVLDPTNYAIISNLTIGADGGVLRDPAIAVYDGKLYLLYINEVAPGNESLLLYKVMTLPGLEVVTEGVLASETYSTYPVVSVSSEGVLVAWYALNGDVPKLKVALLAESGVLWVKDVEDIKPVLYKYGITYPLQGTWVLLGYDRDSGSVKGFILDSEGRVLHVAKGLPEITWVPQVTLIGNGLIAYSGVREVHYVKVVNNSLTYIASVITKYPSTVGRSVIRYGNDVLVIEPEPHSSNKLSIIKLPSPIETETRTLTQTSTIMITVTTTKTAVITKTMEKTKVETKTVVTTVTTTVTLCRTVTSTVTSTKTTTVVGGVNQAIIVLIAVVVVTALAIVILKRGLH
ncbi:MAG TPA: hypothetical protein ENF75_03010 [Acidilobales archaeon]|nr:hypothetical protein [Acidilobales archaeon]